MPLERIDTFAVDRAGNLVRRVIPKPPHRPYEHRCSLAFMKERGCIDTEGKRNYGKVATHLDAMIEYHALREKGPTKQG